MTGNKYLLDTNIIIEVFDNNQAIADKINELPQLFISTVVLGELFVGINRVVNRAKHLQKLQDFLRLSGVLPVDSITAEQYGTVVAALYAKGTPIPTNDVWIAASALQHDCTVVTKDKHFQQVQGLSFQLW